ncbi:uncharacterized protein IUM83_08425 [Phytophthora cinnamomi]|uniref:uncharacterized protein n=1 Tax=Phytophthora cinnamomi TaxID=4785 RepID=UPI00355A6195|nr:hypothetical protein IUM83_08425 [Phytophthora cinnamomi]
MGRKQDPIWDEFDVIRPKGVTKKHPDVSCIYCAEVIMNAQPARHLYRHLLICTAAPPATKTKWSNVAEQKEEKKKRRVLSLSAPSFRTPTKSRRVSYGGSVPTTPTRRESKKVEDMEFHLDIAMAFYTAGIPFRAIGNPYLRRALGHHRPNVRLPTRQSLGSTFLDLAYTMEKDQLEALLRKQKRLIIITDGWSNINGESIVNYVIISPKMRPMMWSSGTTGGEAHTGEFMASEISLVIGEVEAVADVGKVIAVVSDNAANMKKAGRLVEEKHPNVVFNGCSAHAVNLLLKDMFKIELFAQVLKKAVNLVKFVRARHLLLGRLRAMRRQHPSRTGELSVPVSTRWYAQEKCIKSVLRNKAPLKAAFADTELMRHYSDAPTAEKLEEARNILQDRQFWANAKIVLRLTKPVTRVLAMFETDTCSNSMILHEFDRLKNAAVYTEPLPTLRDPTVQGKIIELIEERWKFICPRSNSTRIAYLLDPSKDTSAFSGKSVAETVTDAVKLAKRFGLPHDMTPAIFRSALLDFIDMKDAWSADEKKEASRDSPLQWWLLDRSFPQLRFFADKVLSIPTSSAASERLWSIHGFTQSKLRNRLLVPTLEKLAFVYNNNGDTRPTSLPLYQTPERPNASDLDSDSDLDGNGDDEEECLFDLQDREFAYLLDAIVNVDLASETA